LAPSSDRLEPPVTPKTVATATPTPSIAIIVGEAKQSVARIEGSNGRGSGFVFETGANGTAHVFTNHRVIENAGPVTVWTNDSRQYQAMVLDYDGKRDLAVLEICCGRFQSLSFGNSHELMAGHEVIAIGCPQELPAFATVTKGMVSVERYDSNLNAYVIRTDAPNEPGQ
jgi:S1-C subfamily serine protease